MLSVETKFYLIDKDPMIKTPAWLAKYEIPVIKDVYDRADCVHLIKETENETQTHNFQSAEHAYQVLQSKYGKDPVTNHHMVRATYGVFEKGEFETAFNACLVETPEVEEIKQEPDGEELAIMISALKSQGVQVDGRWGAAKIAEEFDKLA